MSASTAQIPCSLTADLYSRIANTKDQPTLRAAVNNFLTASASANPPQNPVTRDFLIKLRDVKEPFRRSRQITFNVSKPTKEAIKELATAQGVTMSAILRRSIYEYTKPDRDDNLLAIYDGWGDAP